MELQWSLILFTALTGTAGWMYACLAADELKRFNGKGVRWFAACVALAVMIVGGIASVTHLAHPERMMGALGHPTSGIFTEAVLVGLASVCGIVYLVLAKRSEEGSGTVKAFACLAALFGVLLSFMAGSSYMMAAQTAWNTVLLPLGYLATAVPAGVSAYLLCAGIRKGGSAAMLGRILMVGGIVAALIVAAYAAVSGAFSVAAGVAAGAIALSGVAPAAMGALAAKKEAATDAVSLAGISLACAIVGAVLFRCLMWMLGSGINNFFG